MRSFVAGLLVAAGFLLVPLADLGVWTQRELLPTPAFTDLASDVVRQPDVRDALAQRVTDELVNREPRLRLARPLLQGAVGKAVETDQFDGVFRASVGDMHAQLRRGDDQLVLNLDAMLPIVKAQVATLDPRIAAQIPTQNALPAITVVKRDDVPELWAGVQLVRRASWVFPLVTLLLLGLGLGLAKNRARMLIAEGVGLAVIALVLVLVIRLGRGPLSHIAGSEVSVAAFDGGYDTVTETFVLQTAVLGLLGVVGAGSGVAWAVRHRGNARPSAWA